MFTNGCVCQGAMVGLLVSLAFSMWMVTGKFVHGGGSPPRLPLSTQGCPPALDHLVNTTVTTLLTNTTLPEDLLANTTAPAVANITSDHGSVPAEQQQILQVVH